MSYAEASAWMAYRREKGPLTLHRIETYLAVISTQINHALGGKAKVEQFIQWGKETPKELTIESVAAAMRATVKKPRKKKDGGKQR